MTRSRAATQQRILAVATELFYRDGLARVGLDQIAEESGVTKKTIYNHFPSKDDLIAAYAQGRRHAVHALYLDWMDAAGVAAPIRRRILAMFDGLRAYAANDSFRGCGYQRLSLELVGSPGHPARAAAAEGKAELEAHLASALEAERYEKSGRLARQIMVILDGAISQTLIHRDPDYLCDARELADALLARYDLPNKSLRRVPSGAR